MRRVRDFTKDFITDVRIYLSHLLLRIMISLLPERHPSSARLLLSIGRWAELELAIQDANEEMARKAYQSTQIT